MREIHLAKNHLIAPDNFKECYDGDFVMMQIWQVYWEYEHAKKTKLLLDLDDLLVETHGMLKDQDQIRQKYQKLYSHVLVDEFQDTNPSQMEILKLLVGNFNGNGRSFWICGDDWQSIFAFTGASVGNIINFNQVFPNCRQFILHVNYRSTPQILQVCQRLIEHNTRRIEKTLTTGKPAPRDLPSSLVQHRGALDVNNVRLVLDSLLMTENAFFCIVSLDYLI